MTETWPRDFTFSNLGNLPASHCHGRLKPKIKFTILGLLLPNGTLRAMNFEKTDVKQAERVHASADTDLVFASKLHTIRPSGPEKPAPLQKLNGLCKVESP